MLKLAFASAAACLVCCLPIVVPFVVGLAGVGMVGMGDGFWVQRLFLLRFTLV
tara:strand:- start:1314 stop:1472 length:159 start_codon:yes stop_codon:yes gene_type:complete